MKKSISIEIEKCTGCKVCELVCSFKHHGEFNPTLSRIHPHVFWKEQISVPVISNRLVTYKENNLRCDLCGGDPECVKFCTKGALSFVEP